MADTTAANGAMGQAAADFKKTTEEAFQAQMIVANAQIVHQTMSGAANARGQVAATVGQDIRAAARHP